MFKMLTAYTLEADDIEYAWDEVIEQLNLEQNLLTYAAGILMCHPDFIETGVAQEISKRLPFEVIGGTTLASMVNGMDDSLLLSVSVFTSDEVRFSSLHAVDLKQADINRIEQSPALAIPFVPLMMTEGTDQLVRELEEKIPGTPIYGTVVFDHTSDYSRCYTICNGEVFQDEIAVLFFWGDLHPDFVVSEISEKYIQKQRAVITKSKGNMLMEVNDLPLVQYLETIGVSKGRGVEGLGAVPFLVDYGDGTKPAARAIHKVTEEGYAACGGLVPENATLAIGSVEREDVLRMTRQTVENAIAMGKHRGFLMFPCASHFLVLDAASQEQRDIIKELTPESVPYQVGYAGGEICPVYDKNGVLFNRFHSFTFTACIF